MRKRAALPRLGLEFERMRLAHPPTMVRSPHRLTALALLSCLALSAVPGHADPPQRARRSALRAAATCDRTWVGGAATGNPGDWWNPLNWSPEGSPGETDSVCITGGVSTVILWDRRSAVQSVVVASLTLGDPSGTGPPMTLLMTASCPNQLTLLLADGGTVAGNAQRHERGQRGCSGSAVTLAVADGTFTNAGTIAASLPNQSDPSIHDFLQGSLENVGGTIQASNPVQYSGSTLDNAGTITGSSLLVQGGTITNDAEGTISASLVDVVGGTLNQGDGTTSVDSVVTLEGGTLNYTGLGQSTIHARGAVTMTGAVGTGQSLVLESQSDCDGLPDATVTARGFTNFGTIVLTNRSTACEAGDASLVIPTDRLINKGVITVDPGTGGGGRTVQG